MTVRPAKTQISLGISPVWSESSLCAQWVAKDPSYLHADSEYSDQTDLSLRWSHMPLCWFCHEAAHFLLDFDLYIYCRRPWIHAIHGSFTDLDLTQNSGRLHESVYNLSLVGLRLTWLSCCSQMFCRWHVGAPCYNLWVRVSLVANST